ncbi:von Willebrand factor, type A domain and Copine domain-containing protein [Strongyloides ratti]|uniref:von Willebrand factor, type A domain and Copine domain-containing protein n=1 Tax=Strongyloides ratti TaxID=34506 RepID=A0A090KS75_STRRB|nr:von Willebrand factor, type A domain and Copine domain-containing protein [Strongyloides ratti]CEF60236.1 von Willebrand factor, type A domain and Copine domain-containing protein [Strongyloides ratti]
MVYSEELGYDPEEWEECDESNSNYIFAPFTRILLATIAIAFVGFFFWILDARKEWNKLEKSEKDNVESSDKSKNAIDKHLNKNEDLLLLNGNKNIVILDNKRLSDHYTTETILHTVNSANHRSNDIVNREDEQKISSDYVMEQLKRNTESNKSNNVDNNTTNLQLSQKANSQEQQNNINFSNINYPENDVSNDASMSLERTYKELADKIYHNFSKQLQTDIGTIPALNDFSNYKDLANSLTELYDKDIKQAMEDVINQGGTDRDAQNLKHKLQKHIKDAVYHQHNSIDKCNTLSNNIINNGENDKQICENEDKKSSDSDNDFVKIDPSEDEFKKEFSDISYEKIDHSYDYNNERHSAPICDEDYPSIELKPELETISERAVEEINILLQEYYENPTTANKTCENIPLSNNNDVSEINEALKEVIKPESPIFLYEKPKDIAPKVPQHRQIVVDESNHGKHYNIGIIQPQQISDTSNQQSNLYEDNNMYPKQETVYLNQKIFEDIESKNINQLKDINDFVEYPEISNINNDNKTKIYKKTDSIEIISSHKEDINNKIPKTNKDENILLKNYAQPTRSNNQIDNSYKDEPLECINDAVLIIENFLTEATKGSTSKEVKDIDEIQCLPQHLTSNIHSTVPIINDNNKLIEDQQNLSQYDELINKATADIYLQDAIDYVETQQQQPINSNFVLEEDMLEKNSNELNNKLENTDNVVNGGISEDVFEKIEICIDEVDDTITYAPEIQSVEIPPDQLSQASEHVTDNINEPLPEDKKEKVNVDVKIQENKEILEETTPLDGTLTRGNYSKSPIQFGFGEAPKIRSSRNVRNDDLSSITSKSEAKRRKSQSSLLSALGVTSTQEMLLRLTSLDQLSDAMKKAGLESTNLIFGIDYTASNKYQGENSFDGKNLHSIEYGIENPYQKVIKIMGKTLAPFATRKGIPVYGFGDATTGDWSVFKIKNEGECKDLDEVLDAYNRITPNVNLSGPTNFAPLIHQAIEICSYYKEYFILVIIADGQVTNEKATRRAIVQACNFPLSIIVVGVGDGPWEMMKVFDESLPKRPWDNFHFVEFHDIIRRKANTNEGELSFAIHSLLEIPDQYNYIRRAGLMRRNNKMK